MHLVYLDDSKDERNLAFSALCVPAERWQECLQHLIGMRKTMKDTEGIFTKIELHATDWLGGRGRVATAAVPKGVRARLFDYVLSSIVMLPGVSPLNAFGDKRLEMMLFERLVNRIQVFLERAGSRAILISDEGKSFDSLLRRMRRHNYIASMFGDWGDGAAARNIPVLLILEDLVYRNSQRSYFVQAADFCAFALLRSEVPTARLTRYGIENSFSILEPICIRQAFRKDPRGLGIIRAT
jgi:hypothetical protein